MHRPNERLGAFGDSRSLMERLANYLAGAIRIVDRMSHEAAGLITQQAGEAVPSALQRTCAAVHRWDIGIA